MTTLYELSERLARDVVLDFKRFLYDRIDWNGRLIEIWGQRGAGKTTLMLQKVKELNAELPGQALYISLDDIYFFNHSIIDTADNFLKYGGRVLFIDEVHRYPAKFPGYDWSAEIKNINDRYPGLKVVYSGSSVLKLFKGEGDLSRRKLSYQLPGLSFREFLTILKVIQYPVIAFEDILKRHTQIASEITEKIKIFRWFDKYLHYGYFPFFLESVEKYYDRLNDIISLVIETDIPAVTDIPYVTCVKLKKLLSVIASTVPFTPNLTKTGLDLQVTDQRTLLKYFIYLEKAGLISMLIREGKGNRGMRKPEKIYLGNPNYLYSFNESPEKGTVRETFFYSQAVVDHPVTYTEKSDFKIDGRTIVEVGGKNKGARQIADSSDGWLALDTIEIGHGRSVPLWLFGFLY